MPQPGYQKIAIGRIKRFVIIAGGRRFGRRPVDRDPNLQGNISGTEFSPTHFQQRDFGFYEIPLIHLQISPIKRSASTPSTGQITCGKNR